MIDHHLFVIFGSSGDLTRRKLLPSLYHGGLATPEPTSAVETENIAIKRSKGLLKPNAHHHLVTGMLIPPRLLDTPEPSSSRCFGLCR